MASVTYIPPGLRADVQVSQATQSAIEAETDEDTYAPPDLLRKGPWAAKGWVQFNGALTDPITNEAGYNADATTDVGTGVQRANWTTDFSTDKYLAMAWANASHTFLDDVPLVGSTQVQTQGANHAAANTEYVWVLVLGDQ
jgi:hypothetical protein